MPDVLSGRAPIAAPSYKKAAPWNAPLPQSALEGTAVHMRSEEPSLAAQKQGDFNPDQA
jgi:hypothetical protein